MSFENLVVSTYKNKRQKRHIKPIDLNSTQSSALRPQSSNLSPHNFEHVCTELLVDGHGVKFRAPGNSMYPTIRNGDVITVTPLGASSVTTGDMNPIIRSYATRLTPSLLMYCSRPITGKGR